MNTPSDYDPTPEFRDALRHTVTETLRRDELFEPTSRTEARVALIVARLVGIGLAASAILVVGVLFGASTGLASAEVLDARQREVIASSVAATRQFAAVRLELARIRLDDARRAFAKHAGTKSDVAAAESDLRAMTALVARIDRDEAAASESTSAPTSFALLRRIPAKTAWSALACGAASVVGKPAVLPATPSATTESAPTQLVVPTIDLPPPIATSTETLGAVMGINEVSGGRLVVDDSRRRQVRLFDTTLTTSTIALDSAATGYGPRWAPLMPFRGDSSLIPEMPSRTIRVLDARGQIARTIPPPTVPALLSATSYVDERGRLLYTAFAGPADSAAVLRLDLATRHTDTVAYVQPGSVWIRARGDTVPRAVVSWVPRNDRSRRVDDWGLLSEGTIGIVRSRDYRLELIAPNGRTSSVSLPVDSTRLERTSAARVGFVVVDSSRAGVDLKVRKLALQVLAYELEDVLDGHNPRPGAAIADRDGHLWILPAYAPISPNEPLVYDVVNANGRLLERVRVAAGRMIVGFGKGGVVYLADGNRGSGYHLERARLPGEKR